MFQSCKFTGLFERMKRWSLEKEESRMLLSLYSFLLTRILGSCFFLFRLFPKSFPKNVRSKGAVLADGELLRQRSAAAPAAFHRDRAAPRRRQGIQQLLVYLKGRGLNKKLLKRQKVLSPI